MARVKICGINDPAALAAAADADWVGFVFYPPSPRAVTPAEAAALSATRPGGPLRVGLFVEPTDAEIEAALALVALDVLQVHAAPARAADLRRRFDRPVWRAVGVATAADLPAETEIDGYVLDAKPPTDATRPGGNAVRFDWSILPRWTAPRPFLLAGGLTPDNVHDAIAISGTAAVDVSSGVETAPGRKHAGLIEAFIRNARTVQPGAAARR